MKILQVIQFFNPKFGGSVNVCYNLSKELVNLGHEVTIITTNFDFDDVYAKSIQNGGVKVLPFKSTVNLASFLYSPSMKTWLNKHIKEFDIIHMHNFRTYQNAMVHKYAQKYSVPYVIQAHGSILLIIEKQSLKKLYDLVWGNKLLDDASKLIAVSNKESKQYKEFGLEENLVSIVPNGIDVKKLEEEKLEEKLSVNGFKRKHDISTKYMILFLGRIHKRKGLKFLIEAFRQVLHDIENVSLVIAGPDDGDKIQLERLVESLQIKNVKFINYVKNVSEAYSEANILVYPAIYEIFGLVPFEAIACGTPVIVTNDCGCGDIIREAECGFVVGHNNLEELSSKINYLLENPDVGIKMVNEGKKYIKTNLLWNEIVMSVEKLYKNCLRDFEYSNSYN